MYLINEIEFIKINSTEYFMLNLINGAADIVEEALYEKIKASNYIEIDPDIINLMIERKYLFYSKSDYNDFINQINNKIEEMERDSTPNFLVVPTYACNLKCIYCYEQTYMIKGTSLTDPIKLVDIQFGRIDEVVKEFRTRTNKYDDDIRITIMGGEPLLRCNLDTINYIFASAEQRGYSVDIVTNGVDLNYYLDTFNKYKGTLKHIQITVDGVKEIHDQRRIFHNGSGSFDLILKNMKLALENNVKIYLRVNVDGTNIDELPLLANVLKENFGIDENLKPYLYLLQDGGCSGETNIVNEKIGIEKIYELEDKNSNMNIFYKKFHPAEFIDCIFDNKPYQPVLRHCGASKNQFILDCKSNVYKCWHGIGNNDYRVGVFEPQYELNESKVDLWKNRSVNVLEKCKNCKYRYICGTGCPAAKHKAEGEMDVTLPSCVDYKELINTVILEKLKRNQ